MEAPNRLNLYSIRAAPQPRRGLRREEAAIYLGISPRKFDHMVRDGRMPPPKHVDSARVWDLYELDIYFEALPGGSSALPVNEWGNS